MGRQAASFHYRRRSRASRVHVVMKIPTARNPHTYGCPAQRRAACNGPGFVLNQIGFGSEGSKKHAKIELFSKIAPEISRRRTKTSTLCKISNPLPLQAPIGSWNCLQASEFNTFWIRSLLAAEFPPLNNWLLVLLLWREGRLLQALPLSLLVLLLWPWRRNLEACDRLRLGRSSAVWSGRSYAKRPNNQFTLSSGPARSVWVRHSARIVRFIPFVNGVSGTSRIHEKLC